MASAIERIAGLIADTTTAARLPPSVAVLWQFGIHRSRTAVDIAEVTPLDPERTDIGWASGRRITSFSGKIAERSFFLQLPLRTPPLTALVSSIRTRNHMIIDLGFIW